MPTRRGLRRWGCIVSVLLTPPAFVTLLVVAAALDPNPRWRGERQDVEMALAFMRIDMADSLGSLKGKEAAISVEQILAETLRRRPQLIDEWRGQFPPRSRLYFSACVAHWREFEVEPHCHRALIACIWPQGNQWALAVIYANGMHKSLPDATQMNRALLRDMNSLTCDEFEALVKNNLEGLPNS